MPDRYIESHIRRIPLFSNLSAQQLERLAQSFEMRQYKADEIIFRQGQASSGLYVLVSGQAALVRTAPNGAEQHIATLGPGHYVNEQALLQGGSETATLRAIEPMQCLYLARARLLTLVSNYPDLKTALGMSGQAAQPVQKRQFAAQREDEEVLKITRGHWWKYARVGWFPVVVMLGFWAMAVAVGNTVLTLLFLALSLVLPGAMFFYLYVEWRNDAIIITDQRVLRITHTVLTFSQRVSEVAVHSIQEANADIPGGLFPRLFNYGTITLITAGSAGNTHLDFVPNPDAIQQIILEDVREHSQREAAHDRQAMRAELDRWLQEEGGHNSAKPSSGPTATQIDYALGILPVKITKPNGEITYRKHWLIWLQHVLLPGALVLVSLTALAVGLGTGVVLLFPIGGVLFLIGAIWFYYADWDWRNDLYIISDDTISLIHRRPLWLQHEDDQVLLRQVDNVVSEMSGFFNQLFKIGDVRLSLVGADTYKRLHDVGDPLEVQGEISRRQARVRQQERENEARQQREMIGEYLSLYHEQYQNAPGAPQPPQQQANAPQQQPPPSQPQPPTQQQPPQQPAIRPAPQNPAQPIVDRVRPPGIPVPPKPRPPGPSLSPGVPYTPNDDRRRTRPPIVPPRRDNQQG